jgi:hypothetical protein
MPVPWAFGKGLNARRSLTCRRRIGDNDQMFKTLKLLIIFLVIGSSNLALAQITLKIYKPDVVNQDELEIKIPMVSGGSTFELEVDLPSGDADSFSNPAKTYVPVLGTPGFPKSSIFSHNSSSKANDLPVAATGFAPSATLTFEKEITVKSGDSDLFLHAAVASDLDSNDWRVIGRNTSPISSTALEERHKVSFTTTSFCANSDRIECDDLVSSDDDVMSQVYFFLAENVLLFNDEIDPESSAYNHGVYYEVSLSSRVHAADPTAPSEDFNLVKIEEIRRGDESLNLKYRSDFTIEEFDRVIVARYLDDTKITIGGQFIGENATHGSLKLFGNVEGDEFPRSEEGIILVEPLTNGEAAILSIAFVDKYGFVTPLSNSETETPLKVEVLLQEQSCFFFTAGFGREHWVIDELKSFRDQVLRNSPLGNVLIDVYYEVAPKYAYVILDHPWLQATMRGIGYVLVFLIQSYSLIFTFLGLSLGWVIWRISRRKAFTNIFSKS